MNIKNIIIITFLSATFLVTNIGLFFSLHFCEGTIKSVAFFDTQSTNSCCEGECCNNNDDNTNCCNSKTILIQKKETDLFNHSFTFDFNILFSKAIIVFSFKPVSWVYKPLLKHTKNYIQSNAPPLFLLLHSLIFYQ